MKEIYILKVDFDGCMKSVDKPIGFAVETEKQAMKFLEFPLGFRRSIQKIKIVDSLSEVLE